jgi:hypothetical protein
MGKDLYFSSIVTKSLDPINSEERFFEGYLTVEVKDKQGEITIVDELYKVLPVWMDRGAPISDTHSNRIIGKGINFARATYKSEGQEIPAIKITGKIHKNYELDNEIWSKIKSGEYKGLSFGGATKANRTPKVMKDGSVAYQLTDLEHYEVAVCKDPAVPLALITDFNPVAKAMADHTEDRDGKMLIKCSKFGCRIDLEKAEKKEPKLTEGGKKVLQEATTVADLYKVDLRGIETFEGKVEALMDEGKSRESAEKIVGSFTKKNDYPYLHDGNDDTCAHCGGDLTCAHCGEYHGGGDHHKTPHTKEDMKDSMEVEVYENHPELEEGDVFGKPKPKKKDAPTGHDPTQVAHSPDTPREMELEKGKDLSNTAGDTSSMYNQNGAEQRVNSKKAEPNVQQGVAGGEVPPQWTGNGSPYPKGERKVIKRKKVIKTSSWKDLKNKAFDLDMQWRVIDLVKDSMDGKGDNKPKKGDAPQSHADQSKDIKNLDYELDGSHEEGETIGIGRDWDGTAGGLFYKQPKQGKAPIKGKKKALIEIAKKLKDESIQGKLLAGSDPEVSAQLKEHGKEIEEHHKPLKQRTRERHVQPSTGSPQVGLKQLKEQEERAVNNPEDDHWGAGVGKPRGKEYESGYHSMGEQKPEDVKYTGSEVKFREDTSSEPRHGINQRAGESDRDYLARKRAYALENTNAQNLPAKMKKKEGFTYERDHDPENHVGRETKDHARTGSAQQAQYDGTEGKSQSKEKPLKQLTDGELEEVEKLKSLTMELKDAISSKDNENLPPEMLARPKKPKRMEGNLSKEPSDSQQQAEDARRYSEDGGREGRKPFKSTKWRDYSPKTGREGGRTDHFGVEGLKQPTGRGEKVHTHEGKERGGKSKKIGIHEVGDIITNPYNRRYVSSERQPTGRRRSEANERDRKAREAKRNEEARLSIKALSKKLTEELKEGTNAANGTSPRGGDYSGTTDDGKFNVRHNGGRKVNTHGKKAEDLGNFP